MKRAASVQQKQRQQQLRLGFRLASFWALREFSGGGMRGLWSEMGGGLTASGGG
ncbi:hypothetical protein HanRHA438_Chr14g0640631 [Helianthus annuus]|nr:hypothetical protein HanRHA438_Chr14g0640631 [Helianthus annuus]